MIFTLQVFFMMPLAACVHNLPQIGSAQRIFGCKSLQYLFMLPSLSLSQNLSKGQLELQSSIKCHTAVIIETKVQKL